jgi:phosphoribosylformylglycinamidine cyclo-ligase
VLPKGACAVVERGTWPILPLFTHMQQIGNVPQEDMMRTFNMGIGMVLVVPAKKFKRVQTIVEKAGEKAYLIGRIVKGERKVQYA